jgi:hypothetical protein
MKAILNAIALWAFLAVFAIAYTLCQVAEFLTRTRWPRRTRRDLADTFDPVRTLRR